MKMTFKPVTHCLFDLDGTLVDSERIYYRATDAVLRKYGHQHTLELCRKINGTTRAAYSKILVEDNNLPITPEQFLEEMDAISRSLIKSVDALPGVEKLVLHLKKHNIPMAIGTSSSLASATRKLNLHQDLAGCFDHIVSGGSDPEVKMGKPAPDVFLVAARRFKPAPDPGKVLVFEDSTNGVRSALAAGMQTVMIPDFDIVTDEERKIPTLCLKSLEEFKPELFGLPPF